MLSISFGNGNVQIGFLERFVCWVHFLFYFILLCQCYYILLFNILEVPSLMFSSRCFFFQSSAYVVPQLWQPPSGTLMTNDVSDTNPSEEATACIALSKNDSYVMSASGGKVSLFNMMTFKVCVECTAPSIY